jgi:predicted unusual protein kinase regulating ubiquinone biosynthesis (AarF/ABC1/UbiB family)
MKVPSLSDLIDRCTHLQKPGVEPTIKQLIKVLADVAKIFLQSHQRMIELENRVKELENLLEQQRKR